MSQSEKQREKNTQRVYQKVAVNTIDDKNGAGNRVKKA